MSRLLQLTVAYQLIEGVGHTHSIVKRINGNSRDPVIKKMLPVLNMLAKPNYN